MSQRSSSVYKAIADEIIEKIKDGTFKNGSLLPSESALSEKYSVQRTTIRRALKLLEGQYIYKRAGVGSVVGVAPKSVPIISSVNTNAGTAQNQLYDKADNAKKILFVLPETNKLPSYILDAIEHIRNSFIVSVTDTDNPTVLKEFLTEDLLGIILCTKASDDTLSLLAQNNVTRVSLFNNNVSSCVMLDFQDIMESIINTFSEHNHSDICFIGNDDLLCSKEKISQLFIDTALQIGFDQQHTIVKSGVYSSSQAMQVFFSLYRQSGDKITAICTSGEEIATGIIKAANEFGLKVPDDISVISISPTSDEADICCPVICKEQLANQLIHSLLCESACPSVHKTSTYLSGLSLSGAKTVSVSKKSSSVSRRSISDYLL